MLNDLLFDNRHLIMSMDQEKILKFIETIKEIGFNDVQTYQDVEDSSEVIDKLS